jgi:uncharacterized repeat protein (TIGR01451 family)
MKRLLVRISALAVVVVLGFIAIAQAQRSLQGPRQQPAQAPADTATPPTDSVRAQNATPSASIGTPRELPFNSRANPVRTGPGPLAANPVRATAVAADETPASPASGTRADTSAEAQAPRPADPFGLRSREPGEPTLATRRGTQDAEENAGEPALLKSSPPAGGTAVPRALSAPQSTGPRLSVGAEPGGPTPGDASRAGDGTGKPGGQQLEGPQAPQVTIQKSAPAEVQVGRPATFQIKLRNTGQVPAHNVEIRDEIPKGARLLTTNPRASRGIRGELVWSLGTVKPGDEVTVEVQLTPIDEGEIGSVATVNFTADASARTVATKPQLAIKIAGPSKVLIGDEVALSITVTNPGSGIAQKVVLEERVPPGLQHAAGPELEYEVGDLKPNESRQLDLKLTATQAGRIANLLVARGEANLRIEDRFDVEVLAPRLDVAMEGPKRRYLEREATYVFSVTNPGTAPARRVQLVAHLPPGLKFVSANNAGEYEEASRTVHWLLEELPVKETGSVKMVTMPVEVGSQVLRLRGTAEKGPAVEKEQPVMIEGIAALHLEIADTKDPIEINGETTYEINIVNQGTKPAANVQLAVYLPSEMRFAAAEGPTRQSLDGSRILFEPMPRLAPKAKTTYRVRVQGLKPGDLRIRAQLLTDEIRLPITKEESTHVYSDE